MLPHPTCPAEDILDAIEQQGCTPLSCCKVLPSCVQNRWRLATNSGTDVRGWLAELRWGLPSTREPASGASFGSRYCSSCFCSQSREGPWGSSVACRAFSRSSCSSLPAHAAAAVTQVTMLVFCCLMGDMGPLLCALRNHIHFCFSPLQAPGCPRQRP